MNLKIRAALAGQGMKQWQLAKLLGMNEFSLSRKLREELPDEEQEQIVSIIKDNSSTPNGEKGGN